MALPPHGSVGFGQSMGNRYQGNQQANLQNLLGQAIQQQHFAATASVPKAPEVAKDESPRTHLQRRVSKWLSGVELPLH